MSNRYADMTARVTYNTKIALRDAPIDPLSYAARLRLKYPAPNYALVSLLPSGNTGYFIGRRCYARVTAASWKRIKDLINRNGVQPDLSSNYFVRRGDKQ